MVAATGDLFLKVSHYASQAWGPNDEGSNYKNTGVPDQNWTNESKIILVKNTPETHLTYFRGNTTLPLSGLRYNLHRFKTVTSQIYIRTSMKLSAWRKNLTAVARSVKSLFSLSIQVLSCVEPWRRVVLPPKCTGCYYLIFFYQLLSDLVWHSFL